MTAFPENTTKWRLDGNSGLSVESRELSYVVLRYLNLCSEEYYLQKSGYLSRKIWVIWEKELKKTLDNALYGRKRLIFKSEFSSYPAFKKYVESIQSL